MSLKDSLKDAKLFCGHGAAENSADLLCNQEFLREGFVSSTRIAKSAGYLPGERVPMSATGSQSRWYALHVRLNYEVAVSTRLRELGIEEFLPIHKKSSASKESKFHSGPPLFPGYIFSFLNLLGGPRLYTVPGVLRVLGYGGQATPIEEHEIDMLRSITNSSLPVKSIPYFQPGERICLTGGPLSGLSGTFLSSDRGNQLVVSLHLLRRSLAVTVLSEWVRSVPPGYESTEHVAG